MADNIGASEATRELVALHREWVRGIARQTGLQVTTIAKRADLTPTTLTRLVVDPDHPHALSSRTIDKLVREFNVSPPISPDYHAFRQAVERTISALHQRLALQAATPAEVARTVVDLADWLSKTKDVGSEQFEGVLSFAVERLKSVRST